MKKLIALFSMMACFAMAANAEAEIKFDKLTHNFGTFKESDAIQKYTFTFTNVGDQPLILNQVMASCGCTTPKYTKAPIAPGQKGEISVTYNSKNSWPGHFKKSITVRSNGKVQMTRLYIEGTMVEEKK